MPASVAVNDFDTDPIWNRVDGVTVDPVTRSASPNPRAKASESTTTIPTAAPGHGTESISDWTVASISTTRTESSAWAAARGGPRRPARMATAAAATLRVRPRLRAGRSSMP